ncbi:hypothetical protein U1Q18_032788 [Sarracenia purpurea var. burkii]
MRFGLVALAALNPWFGVVFNRVIFVGVALSAVGIGEVFSVLHLGFEPLLGVLVIRCYWLFHRGPLSSGFKTYSYSFPCFGFGASATSSLDWLFSVLTCGHLGANGFCGLLALSFRYVNFVSFVCLGFAKVVGS